MACSDLCTIRMHDYFPSQKRGHRDDKDYRLSIDSVNNTNLHRAENSLEHDAADDGHITGNQEPAPAWTSPPVSRPSSHPEAGKVMRTIFHCETGVWEHVHWRQIFDQEKHDWHELHVSCSLPPPPVSRPPADPVAGKTMRLRFYWETGQWEHEWENGSSLQLPPGPLVGFVYAGPLPPPPPSRRPPPHAIHGEVQKVHFSYDEPQSCGFEYEDGTRLPVSTPQDPLTLETRDVTKVNVGTVGTYHRQLIFVHPSSPLHLRHRSAAVLFHHSGRMSVFTGQQNPYCQRRQGLALQLVVCDSDRTAVEDLSRQLTWIYQRKSEQ